MVRASEEDACNTLMGFAEQMEKSLINTRKQAIDPVMVVSLLSTLHLLSVSILLHVNIDCMHTYCPQLILS